MLTGTTLRPAQARKAAHSARSPFLNLETVVSEDSMRSATVLPETFETALSTVFSFLRARSWNSGFMTAAEIG
jgi:hypothetical protein